MTDSKPLVLIDFSGIVHPLFHLSGNEPDPNWVSTQAIAKVRALASGQPYVAICCDSRKSFRRELDASYKAQREAKPESLYHQIAVALDVLKGDGFPIWSVEGFEADDVIASAVARVNTAFKLKHSDGTEDRIEAIGAESILIVSADKDLLQLVGPRVTQKHALNGNVLDEAAVVDKFGVKPSQMRDWLSLVGDASDNIKGAKGIGAKRATELLVKFGSLDTIMTPAVADTLTPALKDSLVEFSGRCDLVRQLVTLRTDVPVPIEEAFRERVPADLNIETGEVRDEIMDDITETMQPLAAPQTQGAHSPIAQAQGATEAGHGMMAQAPAAVVPSSVQSPVTALAPAVAPMPVEFERQLEPRSLLEAKQLADILFASRLAFSGGASGYGHPAAVFAAVLAGRELGLPAMMSLRAFHLVENKPTLSAGVIQALVLKSPHCRYFRCTERTNERATFVTKRDDDPEMSLTFTIDDGRRAWSKTAESWDKSGWGRNPADMCVARAATKLARLVYPDVVHMYAPEEFD